MVMNLSKLQEMVEDREAWHATVHGLQRIRNILAIEQQKQHVSGLSTHKLQLEASGRQWLMWHNRDDANDEKAYMKYLCKVLHNLQRIHDNYGEGNVLLPGKSQEWRSLVGCSPWGRKELDTTEWLHFHALEKEMATHSSVLAWRIPGMAEPGGLPSMGLHRVRHDWSDLAAAAA